MEVQMDGWTDAAHRLGKASRSSRPSELNSTSYLPRTSAEKRASAVFDLIKGNWSRWTQQVDTCPPRPHGGEQRTLSLGGRGPGGCQAASWTPSAELTQNSLGCLSRASSPYKLYMYLCNASGLMESRCGQRYWVPWDAETPRWTSFTAARSGIAFQT